MSYPTPVIPAATETQTPEPTQLYELICQTFVSHVPHAGTCSLCKKQWPCNSMRLAFRLREGF